MITERKLIEELVRSERLFKQTKNQYLRKILAEDIAGMTADLKHMRGDDKKCSAPASSAA